MCMEFLVAPASAGLLMLLLRMAHLLLIRR